MHMHTSFFVLNRMRKQKETPHRNKINAHLQSTNVVITIFKNSSVVKCFLMNKLHLYAYIYIYIHINAIYS